jgi:integrase
MCVPMAQSETSAATYAVADEVELHRDRIATADEAHRLIAALDEEEQALWGCAMYAGLRLGELRALRAEKIDLALKRIKVHAGWDQYEGEIDPKTKKGKRTTVVIELLEELLVRHLERTGRSGRDLVFGRAPNDPFCPGTVHNHAKLAWKEARQLEDEADTIPHASITVTIDRYGHLLPGGEAEAAEILNEYHARRRRAVAVAR